MDSGYILNLEQIKLVHRVDVGEKGGDFELNKWVLVVALRKRRLDEK